MKNLKIRNGIVYHGVGSFYSVFLIFSLLFSHYSRAFPVCACCSNASKNKQVKENTCCSTKKQSKPDYNHNNICSSSYAQGCSETENGNNSCQNNCHGHLMCGLPTFYNGIILSLSSDGQNKFTQYEYYVTNSLTDFFPLQSAQGVLYYYPINYHQDNKPSVIPLRI